MKSVAITAIGFSAAHTVTGWSPCGEKLHGHTFRAEVCVEYDPADTTWQHPLLALTLAVAELEGRNLDEMIRPARSSVFGVAAWLMDRMARSHRVTKVKVWQTPDIAVELESDPVRLR